MSKIGDLLSNVFQEMARETLIHHFPTFLKLLRKIVNMSNFNIKDKKNHLVSW
jgi:hypothetical protein